MVKTNMSHSEEKVLKDLPSDAVRVLEVLNGIKYFTRELAGHLLSELKPSMVDKIEAGRGTDHNSNSRG